MRAMQIRHPRHFAIVPAAGSGSRMAAARPKQYLSLLGRPLIHHALSVLCAAPAIDAVFVVLSVDDAEWARRPCAEPAPGADGRGCGRELFGLLRRNAGPAERGACALFGDD